MKKKYAEVVLPLPIQKSFHYVIPKELNLDVKSGKRVLVSFGKRMMAGYVVNTVIMEEFPGSKDIQRVIDKMPMLNNELMDLTRWMAEYYCCSWGEALRSVISVMPPSKKKLKQEVLNEPVIDGQTSFFPTREQKKSLESICTSITKGDMNIFLVHGVSGSGKTELYLQSISHALGLGKQVLILLPEVFLAAEIVAKCRERFNEGVALLHSHLSPSSRYREYIRIKEQKASVVIGTRSGIFAPLESLGLIIIDDEHDISYKQEQKPMYNAINIALKRASSHGATVILGSSVPSLESYNKAMTGDYRLLQLPSPVKQGTSTAVKIVDMQNEDRKKKHVIVSGTLKKAIQETLSKGHQIVLLINRRGFATCIMCFKCGLVFKCPYCNIALREYSTCPPSTRTLKCHYCNYEVSIPDHCPKCKNRVISSLGTGTQKLQEEIERLFPDASSLRLDHDTAGKHSHERILSRFYKGKADILIGTQMLARKFSRPSRTTLVGIINADMLLNTGDFRAAERCFRLLTQIIEHASHDYYSELPMAIIQTYNPNHYVMKALHNHSYEEFYNEEIKYREELGYPPFSHLINIIIKGKEEKSVIETAEKIESYISSSFKDNELLLCGPVPAVMPKLKEKYRWQILLKAQKMELLYKIVHQLPPNSRQLSRGVRVVVDVDPVEI